MAALLSRWTRPRPAEHGGLALCAALYAAALTAVVWFALPAKDGPGSIGAAVDVALAALAWVTAEAIWRMRPWAYRAALALAVASVGVFAVPGTLMLLGGNLFGLVMMIPAGGIGLVVLPMVNYLRRSATPVPRPRP